jgi:hypothetical protein
LPTTQVFASDDLPDRFSTFDADKLLLQAAVEVGQAVGIETELGEHRGVKVLDVEPVLDRGAAQLVGLTHARAPLDATRSRCHQRAHEAKYPPGLGRCGDIVLLPGAAMDRSRANL